MSISITLTPGALPNDGDIITNSTLRAIAQPTILLDGTLGTAQIADLAVTTAKLADGAVTAAKNATGGFTPDSTGTNPFAAGWLSALYLTQKAGPTSGRLNCVVSTTGTVATPVNTATITADELMLRNVSNGCFLATAVNQTVNITSAPASNGLDTGSATGTTWYYFWVISDGTNVKGLISASATAPTMPGGYTYKGLAGMAYTTAGAKFSSFYARDRRVWIPEPATPVFTAAALTASWANPASVQPTALNAFFPPVAKVVFGVLGCTTAYGVGVAADGDGTGAQYNVGGGGTSTDGFISASSFAVPVITAQTLYVKAAGVTGNCRMNITGWEF